MHKLTVVTLALAVAAGGCAGANSPLETCAPPLARANADNTPPMVRSMSPQAASFAAWRDAFRARALSEGIRPAVFDAAFQGVGENAEVVRLDGQQAEFSKPIWEYLDGAASADRIAAGRARRGQLDGTLAAIERRYGVDRQAVLAIWGMESNYGGHRGSMPVIESLATLAYEGRRRDFAEEQLVAALRILQAGDVAPAGMVGSWAGAMGHTQFMPTSYLSYAVDFGGDGRRDIWSDDPTDALASAANYLAKSGWQRGRPWGMEVRLPEGFNYGSADQSNIRPVSDWRGRGVTRLDGSTAARPRPGGDHHAGRHARPGLRGLPQLLRHQEVQQRHLLRDGSRAPRRPDHGRRAVRGRLAARGARALPHREDRAAGAPYRPRLRRPARPTG